jgi:hypothetical protein
VLAALSLDPAATPGSAAGIVKATVGARTWRAASCTGAAERERLLLAAVEHQQEEDDIDDAADPRRAA